MSHTRDLIERLCPNGTPFMPLGELARIASTRADPASLSASTYVGVDNMLPNFGGRKDSEYMTNSNGSIRFKPGDVLIGNIRPYLRKVWLADRDGGASPDVMTLSVLPSVRESLLPSFLYYLIASDQFITYSVRYAKGAKMPRGDKAATLRYRVPVPPAEVQREIVRVLDTFQELEADLEADLEAELEARRRQYAQYRDSLLTFCQTSGVSCIPMGELGQFIRGRRFTKADVVEVGIPAIHYGEIYTHYGAATGTVISHVRADLATQLRFAQTGDVVIAAVGETVEDVAKAVAWLGDEPVAIHDDTFAFRSQMNPKFVSYAMQTAAFHAQKNKYVARGKLKRLGGESLAKIEIPAPPLQEQARVVAILDKFDALVDDLTVDLPAELAARRQQFAYYRDRLLTFREAV